MQKITQLSICTVAVFSAMFTASLQAQILNPANGHYYAYVSGDINWDQANAAAEKLVFQGWSGHLATIDDAAEQAFIFENFRLNFPTTFSTDPAWLGGFQPAGSVEPAGGWSWITFDPFTYTNWAPGEPNHNGNENVLEMRRDGLWNDTDKTRLGRGYMVEYEPPFSMSIQVATVEICWNSKSNKFYQVEYSSESTTNMWVALGPPILGNNSISCITEQVGGQPQKFYRVKELP